MSRRRRCQAVLAGLALACLLLSGPAGAWLQGREMWIADGDRPDAIYMLAGGGMSGQDRRVEAVAECLEKVLNVSLPSGARPPDGPGHEKHRTFNAQRRTQSRLNFAVGRSMFNVGCLPPVSQIRCQGTGPFVLTGNDTGKGRWSREEQRNLAAGEWAVKKLGERLLVIGYWADTNAGGSSVKLRDESSSSNVRIQIVPGHISGTDDEMAALATYLQTNAEIRSIVLVTSAFHVRRAIWRLQTHLARPLTICVAPAAPTWRDRAPWTVLAELAKMARDALGLSQAPLLSRKG